MIPKKIQNLILFSKSRLKYNSKSFIQTNKIDIKLMKIRIKELISTIKNRRNMKVV